MNGGQNEAQMPNKPFDSDVAFVKALAELLRANDLTELQVKRDYGENDALNITVSRKITAAPVAMSVPVAQHAAPAAQAAPSAPAHAPGHSAGDPAQHPGAVNSPMVGTAFLSAEPGAAAFVKIGDDVKEGQTLLIIEAMKTMNQIPSPKSGKVVRILVADGSPVEFGEPLIILE